MAAPIVRIEPDNENEPYAWVIDYRVALTETDEKLLPGVVGRARESIIKRRVTLHSGTSDDREIQSLEIALKTLRILHSNCL